MGSEMCIRDSIVPGYPIEGLAHGGDIAGISGIIFGRQGSFEVGTRKAVQAKRIEGRIGDDLLRIMLVAPTADTLNDLGLRSDGGAEMGQFFRVGMFVHNPVHFPQHA